MNAQTESPKVQGGPFQQPSNSVFNVLVHFLIDSLKRLGHYSVYEL